MECRIERGTVSHNSEIAHEQDNLDVLYARLDELQDEAREHLSSVRRTDVGGNHQNRSERDAFATLYEDQLIRLRAAEDGLCFGRIDGVDGATQYIGRIGLSAEDRTQLLMDWRAPASEPFYQATSAHPAGIARRRHIATRRRTVTGIEDDVLDIASLAPEARDSLNGEGALLAALEAERTGRMNDIVATIQAEQDAIIRQDLGGVLVVQGGPGTGKTAVALHRAAYLLFRHRAKIAKDGVLLVGPSPVFLKYIEQVLPSLGETGAVLLTPGQLFPGLDATIHDPRPVAAVKGDLRMVEVLRRAVRNYQRVPEETRELHVGLRTIELTPQMVTRAMKEARDQSAEHNAGWEFFAKSVMKQLVTVIAKAERQELTSARHEELMHELRLSSDVQRAINLAWLPLTPGRVLSALYTKPAKLVAAAEGLLDWPEMARLRRSDGSAWTVDDVALLDEIAELVGPVPGDKESGVDSEREFAEAVLDMTETGDMIDAATLAARYAGDRSSDTVADRAVDDREWTFGHLVVDEAQELTPMQMRVLFRKVPSKSATMVGDLAQASLTAVGRTWAEVLEPHVGDRFRQEVLTVSYRTPDLIMRLANAVLHEYFPELDVPTSVRLGEHRPQVTRVGSMHEATAGIARILEHERAVLGSGKLAVIAPEHRLEALEHGLAGHVDHGRGPAGIDHEVALLSPVEAKGLEFDGVVLVEPESLAEGDAAGIGSLYVALTRATTRLHIVTAGSQVLGAYLAEYADASGLDMSDLVGEGTTSDHEAAPRATPVAPETPGAH